MPKESNKGLGRSGLFCIASQGKLRIQSPISDVSPCTPFTATMVLLVWLSQGQPSCRNMSHGQSWWFPFNFPSNQPHKGYHRQFRLFAGKVSPLTYPLQSPKSEYQLSCPVRSVSEAVSRGRQPAGQHRAATPAPWVMAPRAAGPCCVVFCKCRSPKATQKPTSSKYLRFAE